MPGGRTTVDVLIVGAGQASLATARALSDLELSASVHEPHARVGNSWRFDSLVLFTPRGISALPDVRTPVTCRVIQEVRNGRLPRTAR